MDKTVIVIAGPTASGKTDLSIELAKELQTEIVSFDSRQFYKEMNIGTAKPSTEQLELVKHHFVGHISIEQEYNAGKYETDAVQLLENLFTHHHHVVLTGGSGMYLDAVLFGFDELPKVDEVVREKLIHLHHQEGIKGLQTMLFELDPPYYHKVDLNNPHRIMRALEICLSTGIPYSEFRKGVEKPRNFKTILVGIEVERKQLYTQINARVDRMLAQGLLEEVRSLLPYRSLNALQTVGYKELFDQIEGIHDLETAVNLIKQNTRRFAKRQMTWFRKYDELIWLKPATAKNEILELIG